MSAAAIAVTGYGLSAIVESNDAAALSMLRRRLPLSIDVQLAPAGSTAQRHWVATDEFDTANRVIPELELWIAEWAVGRVFVHAGCVAVDGRALLLPGRSHAGKTTLTQALLRGGASYLSDEYAVLDRDGFVHTYPRPLRVRDGSGHLLVSPGELGADVVDHPLPVGLVAHLRYEPRAVDITPISRADGVLALLDNTVCARSRPSEALEATANALEHAAVLAGARGEAEATATELIEAARTVPPR